MNFDDANDIRIPQEAVDSLLASSCALLKDADLDQRLEQDRALQARAVQLGRDVIVGVTLAMTVRQTESVPQIPRPTDPGLVRLGRIMIDTIREDPPFSPAACGVPRDLMGERLSQLSAAF